LLPGVGFDVVPSDCLASHLKQRLTDATDLKIYMGGLNALSRGTAKSMLESIPRGTRVRRDGHIITTRRHIESICDFGEGPKPAIAVSWGDVSTAYYSTKIPNIEVYAQANSQLRAAARLPGFARKIAGTSLVQSLLKALVDRIPEGPSEEARRRGRVVLVGVVTNAKGERARARLTTSEGYSLTAETSLEIARRVAAGEAKPGFQTPSRVFGADFILQFKGARREELNA
jgi:short subunit dehydrogenase-like uncharacterized protein